MDITESSLDAAILEALIPAAKRMQEVYGEEVTEVMVLKAVIVFQYVDADGSADWGYRRVGASWFDVGGASKMLDKALEQAWDDSNEDEDDDE